MCEKVKLPGGNAALICGLRTFRKFCACGRQAVALCDWRIPNKKSGTCDAPICAQHSKQVAPGKHLCPEHQLQYDNWKRRHPAPQGELFPEVAA
jgi:hypothetical protein